MTTITEAPAEARRTIRAPRGSEISCRGWQQEAALRMLMNNLDPDVAERPDDLVAYGGGGGAGALGGRGRPGARGAQRGGVRRHRPPPARAWGRRDADRAERQAGG